MSTFALIMVLNGALDLALIVGLAYLMTRPAKLTPHRPGVSGNRWRVHRPLHEHLYAHSRGERAPARRLSPVLDRR